MTSSVKYILQEDKNNILLLYKCYSESVFAKRHICLGEPERACVPTMSEVNKLKPAFLGFFLFYYFLKPQIKCLLSLAREEESQWEFLAIQV